MKLKIVEITWKDSWSNSTAKWTVEEIKREPDFLLKSTGYLLHRDRRGINIASEYRDVDKTARHVQHIPATLILKVKEAK